MNRWVDIRFDCLPLRSVSRLDVPLDASPKFRALCENIKRAIEQYGSHNSYFLYNAQCIYHLTNSADVGMLAFDFEAVLLTDADDRRSRQCHLGHCTMTGETCDWLTEPIVQWFQQSVSRAVLVEFDRYIEAGDLDQAKRRIEQIQAASDQASGFLGMYL